MIDEYQVDGVIEIILQACHTYNIESHYVKQTVTNKGKSYLMIETDYSQADKGQIRTRLEAFLETFGEIINSMSTTPVYFAGIDIVQPPPRLLS